VNLVFDLHVIEADFRMFLLVLHYYSLFGHS
jgi:hypothetical protein